MSGGRENGCRTIRVVLRIKQLSYQVRLIIPLYKTLLISRKFRNEKKVIYNPCDARGLTS